MDGMIDIAEGRRLLAAAERAQWEDFDTNTAATTWLRANAAALLDMAEDAERWHTFCNLWAHYTEMRLTQDEDGRWSITGVEAVEADPYPGNWTGDDPDAAIDAARKVTP